MLTEGKQSPAEGQKTVPVINSDRRPDRNPRRERRLWHESERKMEPLGCRVCPDRPVCGGLKLRAAFFDCLQFCCGNPETCDRVCRNHPEFANRVREVGTFSLGNVPRASALTAPTLPPMVPVIYHRTARQKAAICGTAALPLYRMFDRRTGSPRFTMQNALCENFGIQPGTTLLLTGTDRDPPLERWWGLGEAKRIDIIRAMKSAGISLVTTPNYSLFIDRPRQDDLHAIKRIAIVHEEFLREGMPAALHTNGRTEADFARWAEYIAARPEITHIAYEFTTGTGWAGRREQHAAWLSAMAEAAARPLHLVVRGGADVLPVLATAFAGVTVLDTSIFMKTMMRRRAYPKSNASLGWRDAPTAPGAPVDELFAENSRTVETWVRDLAAPPDDGARIRE
ncbi:MAG: hypothetical protein NXH88_03400 [Hyphomonas sp.]|nr:hypothetical protein [Hyphomonas sp.]